MPSSRYGPPTTYQQQRLHLYHIVGNWRIVFHKRNDGTSATVFTMAHSDEEDDYMTMVFEEPPKQKFETSLQRAARERREAEKRSRPKSKAEREAEEEAAREAALSTALPSDNKGFKMMAKFGFKQGDALGKSENARKVPIQINIKDDKGGIGHDSEKKRKFKELAEKAERDAKRAKEEDVDYREQQRQQLKEKKLEKDLHSTQRIAERLHDEAVDGKDAGEIPLKSINVLWRCLARRRLEDLRNKQQEHHLKNSLVSRLPLADEEEDDDYNIALGRGTTFQSVADDLEDEDPELEKFESQSIEDQLHQVVVFLREKHHYCYWCGHKYPDAAMEGCPGVTEEEHD